MTTIRNDGGERLGEPQGDSGRTPSLSPPGSDLDGLVERLASRAESYRLSGPSAEHTAAILYEAATTLLSERALRERVEGERDEAEKDAHELTKALTGLVGGGSEMFIRKRGRFLADIPFCVERIRDRDQRSHRMIVDETLRAKAAEAKISQLEAELKRRDEALRVVSREAEDISEFTTLSGDYVIRERVLKLVRAALQPQEGGD